jgi:hypothetical protein
MMSTNGFPCWTAREVETMATMWRGGCVPGCREKLPELMPGLPANPRVALPVVLIPSLRAV